ncbi:ATP-dependent Clp protease adaptor ClpS [Enterovirga rhinocerotis]|nr:ATP-dependent Clp protease adaptor ClpS [Enterovirga rhinocerotis]
MLLDDDDVGPALERSGVSADAMRRAVSVRRAAKRSLAARCSDFIGGLRRRADEPSPEERVVERVLQRAILRAGSSDGQPVRALDLLVAIYDEPEGDAGAILRDAGLERYDLLNAICHGLAKGEADAHLTDAHGVGDARILLHNDKFTPMECVVSALKTLFGKDDEGAVRIMLAAHHDGAAVVGAFDVETARKLVADVTQFGRSHQVALRCTIDRAESIQRGPHAELLT